MVANHNGGMNCKPTFMIGQFTPHNSMTRPSSSAARPALLVSDSEPMLTSDGMLDLDRRYEENALQRNTFRDDSR